MFLEDVLEDAGEEQDVGGGGLHVVGGLDAAGVGLDAGKSILSVVACGPAGFAVGLNSGPP